MATAKPKNVKVNEETKTIIVNWEKLTAGEEKKVNAYIAAGYKAKDMRKKKSGLTYDSMRKTLKDDKKLLDELNKKIKNKENPLAIQRWFKEEAGMKIAVVLEDSEG